MRRAGMRVENVAAAYQQNMPSRPDIAHPVYLYAMMRQQERGTRQVGDSAAPAAARPHARYRGKKASVLHRGFVPHHGRRHPRKI